MGGCVGIAQWNGRRLWWRVRCWNIAYMMPCHSLYCRSHWQKFKEKINLKKIFSHLKSGHILPKYFFKHKAVLCNFFFSIARGDMTSHTENGCGIWEPVHKTAWASMRLSRSKNVLLQCDKLQSTGDDGSQRISSFFAKFRGKVKCSTKQSFSFPILGKEPYNECFHSYYWDMVERTRLAAWKDILLSAKPGKILSSECSTSLLLLDAHCGCYVVTTRWQLDLKRKCCV